MKPISTLLFLLLLVTGARAQQPPLTIGEAGFAVRFDDELYTSLLVDGRTLTDFEPSEYVRTGSGEITEFVLEDSATEVIEDRLGRGRQLKLSGVSESGLAKVVVATSYSDFPGFVVLQVSYENRGSNAIEVKEWVNHNYRFRVPEQPEPAVWSFQGASYEDRYDWVRPLSPGGGEDNFMGMNASDYGGGIPVIDAWTREGGLATGLLELEPRLVRLPLDRSEDGSSVGFEVVKEVALTLKPGDSLATHTTFISHHQQDYYHVLRPYRQMLERLGMGYADYPDSSYQPVWCGWGYERDVTLEQMLGTLPKARELGFRWAVLDDGWQTAEGDWKLAEKKFPNKDADMKSFTQAVRSHEMRPKLWWAPLAVDPGTELLEQHRDFLLLDQRGNPQKISWWDAYYLCPAYPPVLDYTRDLVSKMLTEWDFDGLKIDGQHLNAAPPCYNPVHRHQDPVVAYEATPLFLKTIYDTALAAKRDAVVEVCPCGTTYALHSLPYTNQPVSSDPESSFQIRLKAKTLKALMGSDVPYYGDHVELSQGGEDFASTVGVGGVIGSKFTLAELAAKPSPTDLTPAKESLWKKWSALYSEHMLPRGQYLGEFYDIGFDKPEAHLIRKDDHLYYAFYADRFEGTVELRGLADKSYQIRDYVNDQDYGTVTGPTARLKVSFSGHLLLQATSHQSE